MDTSEVTPGPTESLTHANYLHLNEDQWAAVERMVTTLGKLAVNKLMAVEIDAQEATIERFQTIQTALEQSEVVSQQDSTETALQASVLHMLLCAQQHECRVHESCGNVKSYDFYLLVSDITVNGADEGIFQMSRDAINYFIEHSEYPSHLQDPFCKLMKRFEKKAVLFSIRGARVVPYELPRSPTLENVQVAYQSMQQTANIKTECLLIVGNPIDLQDDLINDLFYMARAVGVNSEDAAQLVANFVQELVGQTEFVEHTKFFVVYPSINPTIRVHVLWNPTSSELENKIELLIERMFGIEVRIAYSGHGNECGCIELRDGLYSGWRLRCAFDRSHFTYFPKIHLLLNCCYAVSVAASMIDDSEGEDSSSQVERYYLETLPGLSDMRLDRMQQYGLKFEQDFLKCIKYQRINSGMQNPVSLWQLKNKHCLYITPTCYGPIQAKGALPTLYDLKSPPTSPVRRAHDSFNRKYTYMVNKWNDPETSKKTLPMPNENENPPGDDECPDTSQVRIRLFQCEEGDSSVVQTSNVKLFIDGGFLVKDSVIPNEVRTLAAWPHIRHLSKLDFVLLTHADTDHADGLCALMQRKAHFPEEGPTIQNLWVQADSNRWPNMKVPRGWKLGNHIADLAENVNKVNKEAVVSMRTNICQGEELILSDCDRIRCLLPNKTLQEEARKFLETAPVRGYEVTPINYTDIVVIVKLKGKLMLFTGDADGENIADALVDCDIVKNKGTKDVPKYYFDYIDMPHHGSKKNKPCKLLEVIETARITVSTNGKNHGHPDDETIKVLKEYLESHSQCHLYFNYNKHYRKGKNGCQSLSCEFEAVNKRVHFPNEEHNYIDVIID